MLHIFCNRGPSQKLSKPVPIKGFWTKLKSHPQTSVRSVSVGFLPIVARVSGLTPKNRIDTETVTIAATSRWTTAGLRLTKSTLDANIKMPAIAKQDVEVMEFAIQSSQTTIARIDAST